MTNPPPYNFLKLKFKSTSEYTEYRNEYRDALGMIWLWHEKLGDRKDPIALAGICAICNQNTTFRAQPTKLPGSGRFSFGVRWTDLRCEQCLLDSRDRSALPFLLDDLRNDQTIYHVGQHSRFRSFLSKRFPNLVSSQYEEGRAPGDIDENGIRYEDVTRLSFNDGMFNYIVCMEILEHLPDYKPALTEMLRVLKPGGKAILTFPWLGGDKYDHLVRAEMQPDGTILHHLPPEYHGDPARNEGILSFRAFGWKILDELRQAGFADASANYLFSPFHGHMTLLTPTIIACR